MTARKTTSLVMFILVASMAWIANINQPTQALKHIQISRNLSVVLEKIQNTQLPEQVNIHVSPLIDDKGFHQKLIQAVEQSLNITHSSTAEDSLYLSASGSMKDMKLFATYTPLQGEKITSFTPYKVFFWEGLLIPFLAVMLVLLFKNIYLALGLSIVFGAFLANQFLFFSSLKTLFFRYSVDTIADISHLKIYAFILLLMSMVGILTRSGGINAFVEKLAHLAKTARSTKIVTFILGLFIFFDDYANTMVVGTSMRSFYKRAKVSLEKLAYIVDSTAAPIAGLALFSSWIVYEVSQFDATFASNGLPYDGFLTFISSIPFRFYCIFTIAFVLINQWLGRDFGPMYHAEKRASKYTPLEQSKTSPLTQMVTSSKQHWIAVVPMAFIIFATPIGFIFNGMSSEITASSLSEWIRLTLGNADSSFVLINVSLMALLLAAVISLMTNTQTPKAVFKSIFHGIRTVVPALAILTMAWAIQTACADVNVASYLSAMIGTNVSPVIAASAIFLISSMIAFSTGTSYGTMALMIPLAIPLAHTIGGAPLLIIVAGAVLDGSIFGDHCSPISDTTLMSSIASDCKHLEHVRTQLPYAFSTMSIALVFGYIPASMGVPSWICTLGGIGAIYLLIRFLGKPVHVPVSAEQLVVPEPILEAQTQQTQTDQSQQRPEV